MRLRIRGPSGKSSTVTLDDSATIETLRKTIETETSVSSFEIKYGYPPKTFPLDESPSSALLKELDVKLNGEQLIVNEIKSLSTTGKVLPTPSDAARSATKSAGPQRSMVVWLHMYLSNLRNHKSPRQHRYHSHARKTQKWTILRRYGVQTSKVS